jgi:crotonobetainyl-CoA:carnitine CoA-transferase CaiB-like acyl-CoA transferase
MASSDGHAGALAGVKLLSFGAFVAGNTVSMLLADLGADVVKIEPRSRPEFVRDPSYGFETRRYVEPSGVLNNPMNATLTRGCRNLALDMDVPEGRELFLRLVPGIDVLSENFGIKVMRRWDATYEQLRELNPRLVMLSQSGYGRTGPRASYLAYASNISNFTGLTTLWANSGLLSDYATGLHAALGVVAGLRHVARTGQGVYIDTAQIEVMAALLAPALLEPLVNGRDTGPRGNTVAGSLLSGVYRCLGEDRWVAVELEDLGDWHLLCELLGRADLDAHSDAEAAERRSALDAELAKWTAALSPHTAARRLQRAGLAAGAVQDGDDIVRDPQLRQRGFPVELAQPDLGVIEYPGSPHRMTKTPGHIDRSGPRLGEHTDEVLRDWLGLEAGELAALEDAGAIFRAPAS